MGAFFTNIQLRSVNLDESELIEKVVEYIVKFNNEAGFVKVENEDEADKSVVVSTSDNSKWLSVYDEEMEDQDSRKLNKLASLLSKEFETTALSVLVHDSDLMHLGINTNGVLEDSLSNLSAEIDFNKNKPSVWTQILVDNFSFDDIKMAWQSRDLFVEDFLTHFSEFIGLDNSRLLTGYNYISDESRNEDIKLNFAYKDKKKAADLGMTKFSMLAGAGSVDIKEGEKQNLTWVMTNYGTHSKGLDVIVAGECVDKGLLMPETLQTSYIKSQLDKPNEFTAAFIETVATTGEKIFYARIEEMDIPEGFKPTYPMSPKEGMRYGEIAYECAIRFNIGFIGGKDGGGDLSIFFSPLANEQEGSFGITLIKGTIG